MEVEVLIVVEVEVSEELVVIEVEVEVIDVEVAVNDTIVVVGTSIEEEGITETDEMVAEVVGIGRESKLKIGEVIAEGKKEEIIVESGFGIAFGFFGFVNQGIAGITVANGDVAYSSFSI